MYKSVNCAKEEALRPCRLLAFVPRLTCMFIQLFRPITALELRPERVTDRCMIPM